MPSKQFKYHVLMDIDQKHYLVNGKWSYELSSIELEMVKLIRSNGLILSSESVKLLNQRQKSALTKIEVDYDLGIEKYSNSICASDLIDTVEAALEMWLPLIQMNQLSVIENPKIAKLLVLDELYYIYSSKKMLNLGQYFLKDSSYLGIINELYESEKNHYKPIAESLDLTTEMIESHNPSMATRLFTGYLTQLLLSNTAGFMVSLALIEANSNQAEQVRNYYERLASISGVNTEQFRKHFELDLEEEHSNLWKDALKLKKTYSLEEASSIVDALHTSKHAVLGWQANSRKELGDVSKKLLDLPLNRMIQAKASYLHISRKQNEVH